MILIECYNKVYNTIEESCGKLIANLLFVGGFLCIFAIFEFLMFWCAGFVTVDVGVKLQPIGRDGLTRLQRRMLTRTLDGVITMINPKFRHLDDPLIDANFDESEIDVMGKSIASAKGTKVTFTSEQKEADMTTLDPLELLLSQVQDDADYDEEEKKQAELETQIEAIVTADNAEFLADIIAASMSIDTPNSLSDLDDNVVEMEHFPLINESTETSRDDQKEDYYNAPEDDEEFPDEESYDDDQENQNASQVMGLLEPDFLPTPVENNSDEAVSAESKNIPHEKNLEEMLEKYNDSDLVEILPRLETTITDQTNDTAASTTLPSEEDLVLAKAPVVVLTNSEPSMIQH